MRLPYSTKEIVRVARDLGGSPTLLARAFGIHQGTAGNWIKMLRRWGYEIPYPKKGRPTCK